MRKTIIAVLLFGIIAFVLPHGAEAGWTDVFSRRKAPTVSQPIRPVVPVPGAPASFNELVKHVAPAVINISTTKKIRTRPFNPFKDFGPRFGPEDPFRDFFDKFFEGYPGAVIPQHSLGSGFIFREDGHILTNNHVVAGADEIIVTLADERKYKAKVIGRDEETDIAVIKIDSEKPLPFEVLGDSDALNIGDWVVAIGNPFGLSHTVTAGIVSAKGRVIGAGNFDNFIQTDASINPGNSGGPLFNMKGEVVGINSAILASGQGLGFAIPINMVKKLLPQLMEFGKVKDRGWLGVGIQELTPELAKSFNLPEDQEGVLVTQVFAGSPAEQAGIKQGDIITKFNGREVKKYSELPGIVATVQPGVEVDVEIIRDGKRETIKVVLGNREASKEIAKGEVVAPDGADKIGLVVRGLKPEESSRLQIPVGKGVLVERVEPGSSAEYADVRSGDVILEVGGSEIKNFKDYQDAVAKLEKGKVVRLLIKRGYGTIYLAFTLQ